MKRPQRGFIESMLKQSATSFLPRCSGISRPGILSLTFVIQSGFFPSGRARRSVFPEPYSGPLLRPLGLQGRSEPAFRSLETLKIKNNFTTIPSESQSFDKEKPAQKSNLEKPLFKPRLSRLFLQKTIFFSRFRHDRPLTAAVALSSNTSSLLKYQILLNSIHFQSVPDLAFTTYPPCDRIKNVVSK